MTFNTCQEACISILLSIMLLLPNVASLATSSAEEATALRNWKASLEIQKYSIKVSWNSQNPCSWIGVYCIEGSVYQLKMSFMGLEGTLNDLSFPSFANLEYIDLSGNRLNGNVPPQIGSLSKLKYLDLSSNQFSWIILFSNYLEGEIPSSFKNLSNLSYLDISDNKISGIISDVIGNLTNLRMLRMNSNNLAGPIPSTFGKLTSLKILHLFDNHLSGSIPREIGMLRSLVKLSLHTNNFTGPIPSSLSNLTSVNLLHLYGNQLSGPIPTDLGNMQSLTDLELNGNQINGSIPTSFGLLTNLMQLSLQENQLSGPIPHELGNLKKLLLLELGKNQLSGNLPDQICHGGKLRDFTVFNNRLSGQVVNSFRNCTNLQHLRLDGNKLSGNISEIFGILPKLEYLDISHNIFYGEISDKWRRYEQLYQLLIANNNISGSIPASFASANLDILDLSSNQLVGEIQSEFWEQGSFSHLNLRENQISGSIPQTTRLLEWLMYLDLSSNKLTGRIPDALGNCRRLTYLNLSENQFNGEIPDQMSALTELMELDLSHNSLTGVIPSQFTTLENLIRVDISFNHLEGPLPENKAFTNAFADELRGNQGLCGNNIALHICEYPSIGLMHRPNKSHKLALKIVLPLLLSVIVLAALIWIFIFFERRKRKIQLESDEKMGDDVHLFKYETIAASSDNYSITNKLGEGGFGSVYKGKLPDGQEVAIKRLSSSSGQGVLEFKNEIMLIAKLQHTNLVRLLGSSIEGDEKILVYEYMPNKSLDFFLFDSSNSRLLNWKTRFKIIEGIAQGLLYLHKYSRLRVIHRDLKASNILLDDNLNPKISDFGMARIFGLNQNEANTNRVVGTYGYMSPEYAIKGIVSTKTDVFSFGVLVLEIVTGKKNNSCFILEHPLNLIGLAWKLWKEDRGLQLMDPTLEGLYPEKEASRCIQVGLLCVQDQADDRPSMSDVVSMLSRETKEIHTPKPPAFFIEIDKVKPLTVEKFGSCSTNEITISVMEPR